MPVNAAFLQLGAVAQAAGATHIALHSAAPDATGSNQTSAARLTANWSTANGVLTLGSAKNFTGGAASGPVTHVGLWSAATGGTFYGWFAIPTGAGNDLTFNAAGQYTLNTFPITNQSP